MACQLGASDPLAEIRIKTTGRQCLSCHSCNIFHYSPLRACILLPTLHILYRLCWRGVSRFVCCESATAWPVCVQVGGESFVCPHSNQYLRAFIAFGLLSECCQGRHSISVFCGGHYPGSQSYPEHRTVTHHIAHFQHD